MFKDFAASVEFKRTRVRTLPSRIFLCGGGIAPKSSEPKSARDAFHRWVQAHHQDIFDRIILAEDAAEDEEMLFKHFGNLLELERHIALCGSLTLLFVEGPGAIAELGAFSVLPGISDRLVIVGDRERLRQRSFIARGPVLHLKDKARERVLLFDLDLDNTNPVIDPADLKSIVKCLYSDWPRERIPVQEHEFRDEPDMIPRLVAGVVTDFGILRVREVCELLQPAVNRNKSIEPEVSRTLGALHVLQMIEKFEYSGETFYIGRFGEGLIKWRFKKKTVGKDLTYWLARFREELMPPDSTRFSAHASWHRQVSKAESAG